MAYEAPYGRSPPVLEHHAAHGRIPMTGSPHGSDSTNEVQADEWSAWLLHVRHAGDPDLEKVVRGDITREADRAIDAAKITGGMTLLDVGAGDGLVGLRAIERCGHDLRVIFTDISIPMLRYIEEQVVKRGWQAQCTFVHGSAESLDTLMSASVDAVITRASLAYVGDKGAALSEFHRLLRPGALISLAEPVLQDDAFMAMALRRKLESTPPADRDSYMTWRHRWLSAQFPDTEAAIAANPLTNFSERDVLRFVQAAGFAEIHMEVHFDIQPSKITSWETFLGISPHPWAPTLRAILDARFNEHERLQFENITRPMIEEGKALVAGRALYLTAKKVG